MLKITNDQITETSVGGEPITTAYAKSHLRVDHTTDDTLIGNLVTAARQYCEAYCQQSFVQHTYRADLWSFADVMVLPMQPIQSISSVKYYNTASPSVLTTLATTTYQLSNNVLRRVYGQSWPAVANRADAVQITYTTGFADSSSPQGTGISLPESCKAAMLMLIGDYYENREAAVLYPGQLLENRAVKALLNMYRVYQ